MKYVLLFLLPFLAAAQSYKATWDISMDTNVAGFRVLSGSAPGKYTVTNSIEGRLNNTVTLSNVPAGVVYSVAVAYALDGTESFFSVPELMWTNRAFAPKNFKLSATVQAGVGPTGPWTNLANLNIPLPPAVPEQQFYRTRLLLEELP